MTEADRKIVEAAKGFGQDDLTGDLVRLVERLDVENEKLKAELDRAVNELTVRRQP